MCPLCTPAFMTYGDTTWTLTDAALDHDTEHCQHRREKLCLSQACPQQDDLRLLGPPSGQGTGVEARTCHRRDFADIRADSLSTVPPTPLPGREDSWD
ncbi:hypothetical protein PoB_000902800 [Plakobranchus ocellatus]|uniref:Uncharacterized protein n=1 Tax=Plakobranchus ocellatus TaxID=259542 RepID=A0AAV3YJY9_9GAST|nr:hypothetical protein PoB_000902800 [Plakobranchus ocellatus]